MAADSSTSSSSDRRILYSGDRLILETGEPSETSDIIEIGVTSETCESSKTCEPSEPGKTSGISDRSHLCGTITTKD